MITIADAVFTAMFFTSFGIGIGIYVCCMARAKPERKRLDVRV